MVRKRRLTMGLDCERWRVGVRTIVFGGRGRERDRARKESGADGVALPLKLGRPRQSLFLSSQLAHCNPVLSVTWAVYTLTPCACVQFPLMVYGAFQQVPYLSTVGELIYSYFF